MELPGAGGGPRDAADALSWAPPRVLPPQLHAKVLREGGAAMDRNRPPQLNARWGHPLPLFIRDEVGGGGVYPAQPPPSLGVFGGCRLDCPPPPPQSLYEVGPHFYCWVILYRYKVGGRGGGLLGSAFLCWWGGGGGTTPPRLPFLPPPPSPSGTEHYRDQRGGSMRCSPHYHSPIRGGVPKP